MLMRRILVVAVISGLLTGCGAQVVSNQLTVNGQPVPISLYQTLVQAEQHKIERTGVMVDWSSPSGRRRLAGIQSSVIRGLVRSAVIEQLARTRGVRVGGDEVARAVSTAEQAVGGTRNFDLALEEAGTTETVFASVMRQRLLEVKLRHALGTGFAPILERAVAAARVVATVGPCDHGQAYPECLTS